MPKVLIKLRKKWCFGLCDRCVWKYNGGVVNGGNRLQTLYRITQ